MKFPPLTVIIFFTVIATIAVCELTPRAFVHLSAIADLQPSEAAPVIPSRTQVYIPVLRRQLARARMNNAWAAEHRTHYNNVARWLDPTVLRSNGLPVMI